MLNGNPPKPTPDPQEIYELAERYSEAASILSEQAKGKEWRSSAPKLLVDSFAVELYLKCLFVLDTNTAPKNGHDWEKLFARLTSHTQIAIREAFDDIVRRDDILPILGLFNPEAAKVTDFNRSLAAAKNTFDKRRYLYEKRTQGQEWFYADLIREAVRAVTRSRLGM
jgi:hypothetical protein